MRAAAIDVGSNTLRLLIGDVQGDNLVRVHTARAVTRLAQGIRKSGVLRQENMRSSVAALKDFSRAIADYGTKELKAVGTSALRDADNRREFLDMVRGETGIEIEIISGVREAELTVKGIAAEAAGPDAMLIIDIGGGSTEWICSDLHGTPFCGSLPVGVVNLSEELITTDPPSPADIASVGREIDEHLRPLKEELIARGLAPKKFIGTGGTVTTLAAMDLGLGEYDPDRVDMHAISRGSLARMEERLVSLPLERRRDIRGLDPGRADLIIPGILLTIRLMDFFSFPAVTVSDHGLLEGLIKEMNNEDGV
jgi:exopolyphosphatase/guanosine-5'-triphosphate,3'-diphosphate pyrophosphatase